MKLPLISSAIVVAVIALLVALAPSHRELDWDDILPRAKAYSAKLHADNSSQQPVDPSTDALSENEEEDKPLKGVVIVVTGATSGIGKSLTRALDHLGASVVGLGRSPSKLRQLQDELPRVMTVEADLNNLEAISRAADSILEKFPRIDILCNNAGAHDGFNNLWGTRQSTQGYDQIFAVNYLSHFLLTEKLVPALSNSLAPVVLQVSSTYHWGVDGSDLVPTTTSPQPVASLVGGSHGFIFFRSSRSYSNSKLAQIWHARSFQRKHPNVRAVSVCPGWVQTLIFQRGFFERIAQVGTFLSDGWGISSIFLALFDPNGQGDFYMNSASLLPVVPVYEYFPRWAYITGFRDYFTFVMAMSMLVFQRFFPRTFASRSSAESYDIEKADSLYQWSLSAVQPYL